MDAGQGVKCGISVWVRLQAGRVDDSTDTSRVVENVFADGVVDGSCITARDADSSGKEVGPALTHTARFEDSKAARVGRSSSHAVGQTMGILVNDYTSVE